MNIFKSAIMPWDIWIILSIIVSITINLLSSFIYDFINRNNRLSLSQRIIIFISLFALTLLLKPYIDSKESKEFKEFSTKNSSSSNPSSTIFIREGDTQQIYNENLLISVRDIDCVNDSVDVVIGSSGFREETTNDTKIGTTTYYQGDGIYEFRLSSINCLLIKFAIYRVTKLSQVPKHLREVSDVSEKNEEYLRLNEGQHKTIFRNQLFIKLIKMSSGVATIELNSPGHSNKILKISTEDNKKIYTAKDDFIITMDGYSLNDWVEFIIVRQKR